jgi:hypothetical protein
MLHGARLRTHEFHMYTRDSVAVCSMQTLVDEGSGSTCRTAGGGGADPHAVARLPHRAAEHGSRRV